MECSLGDKEFQKVQKDQMILIKCANLNKSRQIV